MTTELQSITIQLLGKPWQIRCPENKAKLLQKCARYLDNKMCEIADQGKRNPEHIAIMAAINAIYDLYVEQSQKDLYIESLSSRIRELQSKVSENRSEIQESLL